MCCVGGLMLVSGLVLIWLVIIWNSDPLHYPEQASKIFYMAAIFAQQFLLLPKQHEGNLGIWTWPYHYRMDRSYVPALSVLAFGAYLLLLPTLTIAFMRKASVDANYVVWLAVSSLLMQGSRVILW
jgi:hypothetical protein